MKALVSTIAFVLFLHSVSFTQPKKPVYPRPDSKEKIPFGNKLPAPAKTESDRIADLMFNTKSREIQSSWFDTLTKSIITNRPGIKPRNTPPQRPVSNAVQFSAKPANTFANFHLTRDINTYSESYPENNPANVRYSFAVLNNVTYFSAEDGTHGRELWRTDGTSTGTYLVKDINPGESGSDVNGMVAANGLLYFKAYTNEYGEEPWVSDGSAEGTHLLADVMPGPGGSYPNQFVNANGEIFFVTSYYNYNSSLWKTNGTAAGTQLVKDISLEGTGYLMLELTAVNDMAFFIAYTWSAGYQLFRSDGSDPGTQVVKTIGYSNYYEFYAPMQLTAYNNQLFFSAFDGYSRKLWVSDGTYDGTDYAPGYNEVLMQVDYMDIYRNFSFKIINNVLFFAGYTEADGGGLYKYDASNGLGEVLVKDLTDMPDYPYDDVLDFVVPVDVAVVGDQLYFKVISNINGFHDEIWRSDGDPDHTELVKTIGLDEPGVYTYNLYGAGNFLYFVVNNSAGFGNELWKSDGTEVGTTMVKDINPGPASSYPDDLTAANGKLLFRATEITHGSELWQSDGTENGTMLVKDINVTTTAGSDAGFFFKGLSAIGNDVLVNAFTPALGAELYRSDGTEAGTVLLNDIAPGPEWSFPNAFLYKNNATYFINDNVIGTSLYKTDGTTAGLKRVTAYINRDNYSVHSFNVAANGRLFYVLYNKYTGDYELWTSNGSETSGDMLKAGLYYDTYVVFTGNTALFVAGDYDHGFELWKSDGTPASTTIVKDINPGFNGSYPYSLFEYKGKVYFGAFDGYGYYNSFWQSDGTEKGTIKLENVTPAYYSYPHYPVSLSPQVFCISNGKLYFNAYNYTMEGDGLWVTNGTPNGTKLVKNINPFYTSFLYNLTDVNGTIFFTGDDGIHGTELWKSNGTEQGSVLVKDISPDGYYGYYYNLCNAGGKLYFLNDGTYPNTLWSSDGTTENTNQVVDAGLDNLYNISNLTPAGNHLFFGAWSAKYGTELYVGDLSGKKMKAAVVNASYANAENLNAGFDAALYPNPAPGNTSLQLSGDVKNITVSITDITGKSIWKKGYNDQRTINLPAGKMSAGIYLVTVRNSKESKTLKFIRE